MFLYIHLQIPYQQQDSSFNLTFTIYPSLVPYINPRIIHCKYPVSLSPNILSFSDKYQNNPFEDNATTF